MVNVVKRFPEINFQCAPRGDGGSFVVFKKFVTKEGVMPDGTSFDEGSLLCANDGREHNFEPVS